MRLSLRSRRRWKKQVDVTLACADAWSMSCPVKRRGREERYSSLLDLPTYVGRPNNTDGKWLKWNLVNSSADAAVGRPYIPLLCRFLHPTCILNYLTCWHTLPVVFTQQCSEGSMGAEYQAILLSLCCELHILLLQALYIKNELESNLFRRKKALKIV